MKKRLFIGLISLFMAFGLSSCGSDGKTPYIGDNGNWWIGETDLGVPAAGKDGSDGKDGKDGKDGENGSSITVTSVEKTNSSGLVDTYVITFSDGTTSSFTVTNGESSVIESIELSNSNGLTDTYTITFTNGSTKTFTVTNGQNGTNLTITSIGLKSSEGLIDTYEIVYSDGSKFEFAISNGADGLTPYIGDNGNWWIGESDTGVLADWEKANNVPLTDYSNGLVYYTWTIDGKTGYVATDWDDDVFSEYMTYKYLEQGMTKTEAAAKATEAENNIGKGHLVIPNYIGSVPVIGVSQNLKLNFNKVTLSRNTIWLGAAFASCNNLEYIDFNNCKITAIQDSTFYNTSLTSVSLPSSVTVIGDNAFSGVPLTDINLDNITYIGSYAFDSLVTKHGVYLPKTVNFVGSHAFESSLLYLERETIPDNWGDPLTTNYDRNGLTPLNCKKNDDYIYSVSENAATIYQYLGDKTTIIIPDEIEGKVVTKIGYGFETIVSSDYDFTFSSYESIKTLFPHKEIILSTNIVEIEFYAFCGVNLTIFASSSLQTISETLLLSLASTDLVNIYLPSGKIYAETNYLVLAGNEMPIVMDGTSITQVDTTYTKEYVESYHFRLSFNIDYSSVESDSSFYYLNDGNSYSILNHKAFDAENLIIPSNFNDKPVTTILSRAIGSDSGIKTIVIENGIVRIKPLAISCKNVTSITIPLSVLVINENGIYLNSRDTIIYCYASSKPVDWDSSWTNYLSNAEFGYSLS